MGRELLNPVRFHTAAVQSYHLGALDFYNFTIENSNELSTRWCDEEQAGVNDAHDMKMMNDITAHYLSFMSYH